MNDLKDLYLKAKDAYYNEQPIMSDSEFDEIEKKLKEIKSEVINKVGYFDRYAKIKHPTPMKSLEKIQADKENGNPPIEEFETWFNDICKHLYKFNEKELYFEVEPKLDGNAVNLVYYNGKLCHALSRGDGNLGRDYISKINLDNIPLTLSNAYNKNIVEIRCEAVIDKEIFKKKYSNDFSNERNYVAGVLNSDNCNKEQCNEIDLIPVEMKVSNENGYFYKTYSEIEKIGFKNNISNNYSIIHFNTRYNEYNNSLFKNIFNSYKQYKDNFKYRIDGMVLKLYNDVYRNIIGEVEHHPKWAIAVKFKPEDCVTEIIGFEMEMGKTGNFTPVALLKPVDLDGSIVSKASAYNYNYIFKNNLNVGSMVTLVKSGDIIPQIVNVVCPSDKPYDIPEKCPYCGEKIELLNNKHIHCPNENCIGKKLQKFIYSFNVINLYGIGASFVTDLFYKVNQDPKWYFTNNFEMVKEKVVSSLGDGKIVTNFIEKISKIKEIKIEKAISFLSFDGISDNGKTVREIAKKISNIPYSFNGLEKKVVEGWNKGENKYEELMSFIDNLENNDIKVIMCQKQNGKILNICMTGSPKNFGYKTKNEYKSKLSEMGYSVNEVSVADCDYLITDDINSNSSKMNKAKKLNKNIKTYNFLEYD